MYHGRLYQKSDRTFQGATQALNEKPQLNS